LQESRAHEEVRQETVGGSEGEDEGSQKKRFKTPAKTIIKRRVVRFWSDPENRRRMKESEEAVRHPEMIKSVKRGGGGRKEVMARKELKKKHPVRRTPGADTEMRE